MAFLSNLFGSGDSDSTNENSSDLFSDLDAVLSVDASNVNYSHSVDDDGSSDTSYSAQDFGTDLDVGNLLAGMTDSFSHVDG